MYKNQKALQTKFTKLFKAVIPLALARGQLDFPSY
jgi:hypothetical protein